MDDSSWLLSSISSPPGAVAEQGGDELCCGVCLEQFRPALRPPKVLPCGHNFCEQCLYAIYCHQQYYLLDSISCPTCRASFPAGTALSAPTNFDLCKVLDRLSRHREANITVIRVNGNEEPGMRQTEPSFLSSSNVSRRKSGRSLRCGDCGRKMASKALHRAARVCSLCCRSGYLELSCLECCIDVHDGHGMLTIGEAADERRRAAGELRALEEMTTAMAAVIEGSVGQHPLAMRELTSLLSSEQREARECARLLREGARALAPSAPRPLAPASVSAVRRAALQRVSRLSGMVKALEHEHATLIASAQRKQLTGSQLRQSRLCVRGGDGMLARESLTALLAVLPASLPESARLATLVSAISPSDTNERRISLFIDCVQLLSELLAGSQLLPLPSLPHVAEALLHAFSQMNDLSRKRIGAGGGRRGEAKQPKLGRPAIWKAAQRAYSELIRVVSKQFSCTHPERIGMVDDLSLICRLFADVCDQASITICMIEAARARAAVTEPAEAGVCHLLKRIDDNLTECRRVQKLQALRSSSSTSANSAGGLKRLFSCLRRVPDENEKECE